MPQAKVIDGTDFADKLRADLAEAVRELRDYHRVTPGLAVVLVGEDPASRVYVRSKNKRATEIGMKSFEHILPTDVSEKHLLTLIEGLNDDPAVHGILVQLPLPRHIDAQKVIEAIDPAKDVDGFHPMNAGRLFTGGNSLVPCTPLGCLLMLKDLHGDLSGMDAVVIGRSNIVGKPMAQLLLQENCTVTIAHSRTRNLPEVCARADILVAAVGMPNFVRGSWVKPGATVIDVGINRVEDAEGNKKLVGDVNFAEAAEIAGAITPVPGGVGPMTIAVLLRNTLLACCRQRRLKLPACLSVA